MPDNRMVNKAATDIITSRTLYHWSPRWTGTFKTSDLVPVYARSDIRPGDTVKMNITEVIRATTPVFPVMDDAYLSIECFFIKHKHVLNRRAMTPDVNDTNYSWKAFIGAQDSLLNMPLPDNTAELPKVSIGNNVEQDSYLVGGLADCLKMPPAQSSSRAFYDVNPLKFLAYYDVWSSYFRDANLQNPVTYHIDNGVVWFFGEDAGIPSDNEGLVSELPLAKVCRDHGYFGSALPWPQRNSDVVDLPLGDIAPVYAGDQEWLAYGDTALGMRLHRVDVSTSKIVQTPSDPTFVGIGGGQTGLKGGTSDIPLATAYRYTPINLYADLSEATAATVNQVRYAFATQRWFEQLARSGNRYDELVFGMTGVRQSDAYDDRPEYLGGKRIPITQSQVNSTAGSQASASSVGLGSTGAFTHMADSDFYFSKSFDDFGTLLVLAFVRVKDTFAQGIARQDTVFDKFSLFWSQYANIGEVAIKNKEIFVTGTDQDEEVFGYQEAWADYRLELDGVTGLARPSESLKYLTYANDFDTLPTLKSFICGDQVANVDRTLTVTSEAAGFQWFGQFQFDMTVARQVPAYSIPGYIDHH